MTYVLTPGVESEIARIFKPEDVEYVRAMLSETELPWDRSGPAPRIHLAILLLARGDKKRLEYELGGATSDWRDTLVEAGLGNGDWPDVLRRRGVDLAGIDLSGTR
jgi:hypothetical protein